MAAPLTPDLAGPWLEQLAALLTQTLDAAACVLAVWHVERGQIVPPAAVGLDPAGRAELVQLLTAAAPDVLGTLVGARPGVAHVGFLPGWNLDRAAREARRRTPWGLLHVLALPVDGYEDDEDVTPLVGPPGEVEAPAPAPGRRPRPALVVLAGLLHSAPRLAPDDPRLQPLFLVQQQIQLALEVGRLRARLVDESRWLRAILEQAGEALLLVDSQGRIVGGNAAAAHLTGWRVPELLGRPFVAALDARVMYWDGAAAAAGEEPGEARWSGPLAEPPPDPAGGPPHPRDLVLTGRHGEQIYTEASVAQIRDAGANLLGAVVGLRDVSAQRQAEELQATFLSVISHELQTPLAVIRGYAELLADRAGDMPPAQLRDKLTVVADESARLSAMVANLLDASRIQAGGLELQREPVSIARLVQQTVQQVAMLTTTHRFVIAIPDDLPPVLADYDRVAQVLRNLLENAVKYSPGGGNITITADLTSEEVIVHVIDEGIGVPSAEREQIFSRFARLDSRVVRQAKGVGLGLYIARAIIRAHGGRIWVDAGPGGGAQFSFSLPRQYKAPLPVLFGRG